ncbi:MAG: hypothetical protein UT30_C0008G0034 [Candidatus Uhrbacteria bacterium GW2011_GWF2_39_13]|uniref:Beta-galactosidase trimerisation domain-containing protein n=1 Tax=Candidatus Uhrbacteria bacterium GW2011_GWF2_39_13 TaxID=1618995 RepID=A0A0G0QRZ3_9BACT|nr:MAG: hypothetical protein UT30_C0008G0034 [Candidatus Uhrbacteria bacterium GW2011_GWF2_39_13]
MISFRIISTYFIFTLLIASAFGTEPGQEKEIISIVESGRTVFQRMEPDAGLCLSIRNSGEKTLSAVSARINSADNILRDKIAIPDISPQSSISVKIPIDTTLKPGKYDTGLHFTGMLENLQFDKEITLIIIIVPRQNKDEFPVILWSVSSLDKIKGIGFTHAGLPLSRNYENIWKKGKPLGLQSNNLLKKMDDAMSSGIRCMINMLPGECISASENLKMKYQRIDRNGGTYRRCGLCGNFPEIQNYFYNVGASIAMSYGKHPAFQAVNINTEVRDTSEICFHKHDRDAYITYSGEDFPAEVSSKRGLSAALKQKYVPVNGIVPDDNTILKFYKWFWKEGDAWNILNSKVHEGLKTSGRPDFWTFNDPAGRVPPTWGSGGDVDAISHWTYTYPDPLRMALAVDELFAMAKGKPGQKVMKMTQVIWYRKQTAPTLPAKEKYRAEWEKKEPDATFITTAPDHLREAFWLKISRPVQGIMYFGTGVLFGEGKSQRLTNPETLKVLSELLHKTLAPLGPTLLQVPGIRPDVAILESFTSSVFGEEATWGWARGWTGDAHLMLQWARLQPEVIYEETIVRDGLDGVKVLLTPNCSVLPVSVFEKIREFQRKGGIIVADQNLAPALKSDILLRKFTRNGPPDKSKTELQNMASKLRDELKEVYTPSLDSSDSDVIVYRRAYKDTDYIFAINDKRTYGDYVGHHRKVMEKGLPNTAELFLKRKNVCVYDLTENREILTKSTENGIKWNADLAPGGGRLYMVSSRPLEKIIIDVAPRKEDEQKVRISAKVTDKKLQPLDAVVPMEIKIIDPKGKEAEFSGYYGAKDGIQEINLDLAKNDGPGTWIIKAKELATGKTAEAAFKFIKK